MITIESIQRIVYRSLRDAAPAAAMIKLGEAVRDRVTKSMVGDLPTFATLKLGDAVQVWSTILFVDMRSSTSRAQQLGPQKTYLTMHALLPAMAYIATQQGGFIVGFRGDGLFAAFGINQNGQSVAGNRGTVVGLACATGLIMVEAVQKVINPILQEFAVPGDVKIGIGIDVGDVVITRIGLPSGFEITAYGDAVNSAAKLCSAGKDEVIVSAHADDIIPASASGKLVSSVVITNTAPARRVASTGPMLTNSSFLIIK